MRKSILFLSLKMYFVCVGSLIVVPFPFIWDTYGLVLQVIFISEVRQ